MSLADVKRLGGESRSSSTEAYPEELWGLCSAQSLSVCTAGQESIALATQISSPDYAVSLLKSLLHQARLRIPRLTWACASQLAITICRVTCMHATTSLTSCTGEGNHPIDGFFTAILTCGLRCWLNSQTF